MLAVLQLTREGVKVARRKGWNSEVSRLDCEMFSIGALGRWSDSIQFKWSLVLRKPGARLSAQSKRAAGMVR